MAGEIKFKFDSYHDSTGVKEVVLGQGDGVRPAVAKQDMPKGRSLEDLLASAKSIKPRIIEETGVVIEKKFTAEQLEKMEEYKDTVLAVASDIRSALEKKQQEGGYEPAEALAIFDRIRGQIWRQNYFEKLEGEDLKKAIKEELLEGIRSSEKSEAQTKLVEICEELFGVAKKEVKDNTEKETVQESQEVKERKELIGKVFGEIFDDKKFLGRTIEVAGEKPYSISRAIAVGNFDTGAVSRMRDSFLAQYDGNLAESELRAAVREYCREHVHEFAKKELQAQALLLACEGRGGEKAVENVDKAEMEKIQGEIDDLYNMCADLYREVAEFNERERDNGLYVEEAKSVFNENAKEINQINKEIDDIADKLENKGANPKILTELKFVHGRLLKISNDFAKDMEQYRKAEAVPAPETISTPEKAVERKNTVFEERLESLENGMKWRMESVGMYKDNPDFIKRVKKGERDLLVDCKHLQKGLNRDEIKALKKRETELNKKLIASYNALFTDGEQIFAAETKPSMEVSVESVQPEEFFETPPHEKQEEVVDKHYEFMPEVSKEEQEFLLEVGREDAKALLQKLEEKKYFKEYVSDGVKKDIVRGEMKLYFIDILHENFHELDKAKIEDFADKLAKEVI